MSKLMNNNQNTQKKFNIDDVLIEEPDPFPIIATFFFITTIALLGAVIGLILK